MEPKNFFEKLSPESKRAIVTSVISSLVTFVIIGGIIWLNRASIFNHFGQQYIKQLEQKSAEGNTGVQSAIAGQQTLVVSTVKKSDPSVVSIIITKNVPKYETIYQNPFGVNSPFGNLFQIPSLKQNGTEKKEVGGGSGFFVNSEGLIVTNRHVVNDKNAEYTVLTNDGKKHDAKVVARDTVLDVALIKIDGSGYSALSLGDSDKLELGQSVIAIGNALGEFRNSVSVGVISGLARSITAGDGQGQSEALDHVIQTDAAINPGNSGGPLLDIFGNVVGVNVAVAQGSENIGFSLPINSIKSVINSVEKTGKIVRPYLGVRYITITQDIKDKNNLSVDYGVLVKQGATTSDLAVIPGGPADKAGIVENDIILEIDGKKLDDKTSLATIIRENNVGDVITLKILHKGEEKVVKVTLEEAKDN